MRLAFLALLAFGAYAEPRPGEVFREFTFPHRFGEIDPGSKRQEMAEARRNPSTPRELFVGGVTGAIRAEIVVEYWGGHIGTSQQAFRVNDHEWIDIPQPEGTPTPPNHYYRTLLKATVEVPLDQLKTGVNAFRFRAGPQTKFSFDWGFYWVYGFTVRVYSQPGATHPSGRIVSHADGAVIGDMPRLAAETRTTQSTVSRVDFLANYEDFNWEGDGRWRQWHYILVRGEMRRHIGTATGAQYAVTWDTSWVPDQKEPIEIAARITDNAGNTYMTEPVRVRLQRRSRSVRLYKPADVPEGFGVRVGRTKECRIPLEGPLQRARAARLVLSTWSAAHEGEISLNGRKLVDRIGVVHNFSFDAIPVPISLLKEGDNVFRIFSNTKEHAAEVNWPGPALLVEYAGTPAPVAPAAAGPVSFTEDGDELRIRTATATWIYQKSAGALAGVLDPDGRDWIGWKPTGGSAGNFRGIPNLGDFAHPGEPNAVTTVVESGPGKLTLRAESKNGGWAVAYDFLPRHVRVTVERASGPYWFLYEGTPAGSFDAATGYYVLSNGERHSLAEPWNSFIDGPRWAYFGDSRSRWALFVANHQKDGVPDQYWPMQNNMTVFGFGRQYTCCGKLLSGVPAVYTVGLAPVDSMPAAIETAMGASLPSAQIENSKLRVLYGRGPDGKDKLAELFSKENQRVVGEFDSRHSPVRTGYYKLKSARVEENVAQLDFGTRRQAVRLLGEEAVVEVDYQTLQDNKHTYDRGGRRGSFAVHGAREWLEQRKRHEPGDTLYPLYKETYYRSEWAAPGPLSYHGWMILGMAWPEGGGYGLLLPADQVLWLKLMGGSGGFERMMKAPYKAYYFYVPKGDGDTILSRGREIVDKLIPSSR